MQCFLVVGRATIPGMETLDEIAEKERFFQVYKANVVYIEREREKFDRQSNIVITVLF